MALGRTVFEISTGGGSTGPGAQAASRQLVLAGVSPAGTAATLYKPQSASAIRASFDVGPLAEALLYCQVAGAPPPMALPINPSVVGGVSAVTQVGTGLATIAVTIAPHRAITVLCTLGGAIATAKFKFSLDGGVTYGAEQTSADSGGGSWVVRVPGTFCTLTFAAAVYVITKTNSIAVDGTVTPGAAWVGVVTQASSPIDVYEPKCTVLIAGATGTAQLQISLDNGESTIPPTPIPTGGVVVIPNTGLVLTCSSGPGNFVALDTYSFLAGPPGYSTTDLTNAMTALRADSTAPTACMIVCIDNAAAAVGGFSAASTLDTAIDSAFATDGLDWQGRINVPCSEGALGGDVAVTAGTAARSTITSANIRTARVGITLDRVGVSAGAHRVTSSITGANLLRPTSLILAKRYAATIPSVGVANRDVVGPLDVYKIGRDELYATTTLHDVQVDTLQTIRGSGDARLSIESGGFGFRNLTLDAQYQDADFMRIVCAILAALRPVGAAQIGSRPRTNANGTIHETAARKLDALFDKIAKQACGLATGGAFNEAQVSTCVATVDRSSQLNTSPRELVLELAVQSLGFVSSFRGKVRLFGAE